MIKQEYDVVNAELDLLIYEYNSLEKRLLNSFEYISLCEENLETLSAFFVNFVHNCCPTLQRALQLYYSINNLEKKDIRLKEIIEFMNLKFECVDSENFVVIKDLCIQTKTKELLFSNPVNVCPFISYNVSENNVNWWKLYNSYKHKPGKELLSNVRMYGNLQSSLECLGLLFFLINFNLSIIAKNNSIPKQDKLPFYLKKDYFGKSLDEIVLAKVGPHQGRTFLDSEIFDNLFIWPIYK